MPRLKNIIPDNDLLCDEALMRKEQIPFGPKTYEVLNELAKHRMEVNRARSLGSEISRKKAVEQALMWFKTLDSRSEIVQNMRKSSFYKTREEVHKTCLEAFLKAHPRVRVRENGSPGRPRGYIPESKALRFAMGEVIADLINSSPEVRKLLKAA